MRTGLSFSVLGAAAVALGGSTLVSGGPIPPQPHTHRNLTSHVINLDLAPEDRYTSFIGEYNATIWEYWLNGFSQNATLRDALFGLVDARGNENDEQHREILGLAAATNLPLKFVQGVQFIYEVGTLMVDEFNATEHPKALFDPLPPQWEILRDLPWGVPGCTGIIARNSQDGTVYHARNQDLNPVPILLDLNYIGIFEKGGKEVFRSQMVAGYTMPITAARFGPDGYAIERNTRFSDHKGGNVEMLHNLLVEKRNLNGWQLRKILETNVTFDDAIAAIQTVDYVSTEYTIVSGVQKGAIASRNPSNVAHLQVLGKPNYDEPEDYIIMTNFDFFFHDEREAFDSTAGKIGHPTRREVAQEILNASIPTGLTQDVLFETINAQGVIADTVFQSIINIEKGIWNVSQPNFS